MAEIVFILICAIPAMLGLSEILHSIKLLFMSSGKNSKKILIIVPDKENFASQILGIYEQVKWHGKRMADKIIVADTLLDDKSRNECEVLARKLNLEVCSEIEILNVVKG